MGKAILLYHVSYGGDGNHTLNSIHSIGNNFASAELVRLHSLRHSLLRKPLFHDRIAIEFYLDFTPISFQIDYSLIYLII